MTPSPTEDAVQTARELMLDVLADVVLDALKHPGVRTMENTKRTDDAIDALIRAVEHRVRAEGVAQRIGYAVWDVGSPTLLEDSDPAAGDEEFVKPTRDEAQAIADQAVMRNGGGYEVVEVRRLS